MAIFIIIIQGGPSWKNKVLKSVVDFQVSQYFSCISGPNQAVYWNDLVSTINNYFSRKETPENGYLDNCTLALSHFRPHKPRDRAASFAYLFQLKRHRIRPRTLYSVYAMHTIRPLHILINAISPNTQLPRHYLDGCQLVKSILRRSMLTAQERTLIYGYAPMLCTLIYGYAPMNPYLRVRSYELRKAILKKMYTEPALQKKTHWFVTYLFN